MIQRPTAAGLLLAEKAVIEEKTRNVTLVNCFGHLTYREFPTPAQQFIAFAVLTDGIGKMTLTLTVARLEDMATLATRSWQATFASPLQHLRFLARAVGITFPVPSRYQVALLADGETVAQRVLTLAREGG